MQSKTDNDAVPCDILPQKWLMIGTAAGLFLLACGVVMGGYSMYVDHIHPQWHLNHETFRYAKESRGISWYFWAPLFVGGFMMALFSWASYWYDYQEVLKGTIVKEEEFPGFFNRRYYFVIEGKNRARETRRRKHEVGQKTYFKKNIGDEISFKE